MSGPTPREMPGIVSVDAIRSFAPLLDDVELAKVGHDSGNRLLRLPDSPRQRHG